MCKQDREEIYQERTGINCKSEGGTCACAVDVPFYKIRPWKLKGQTLGENGDKLETVAYFIQVRSADNECDMKQVIADSIEVSEFEYKRISRQKQKWLRKLRTHSSVGQSE